MRQRRLQKQGGRDENSQSLKEEKKDRVSVEVIRCVQRGSTH